MAAELAPTAHPSWPRHYDSSPKKLSAMSPSEMTAALNLIRAA